MKRGRVGAVDAAAEDRAPALRRSLDAVRPDSGLRFLAAASHELRQPLQALNLFVSTLVELETDPAKLAIIDKTQVSVDALTRLLNALLDISKLDAGLVEPELSDVGLRMLGQLAEEFEPVARSRGLALSLVPTSLVIRSDPVLLASILRNLIANAVSYTDAGRVLVGCRRRGATAWIEVWDTGCGIAADQQDVIFQEFCRLGDAGRDRAQGLGLGLSIVRRTADLLGHRIGLRSAPGRGSVFSVEVPVVECAGSTDMPAAARSVEENAGTIILVDDEPAVLDSLALLLSRAGYDVRPWQCTRPDADELVAGVVEGCPEAPHLIVSDYRLSGGLTGVDVVRGLRERYGQRIPAILISGDISEDALGKMDAGDLALLHKPVRAEELRAVVARMKRS